MAQALFRRTLNFGPKFTSWTKASAAIRTPHGKSSPPNGHKLAHTPTFISSVAVRAASTHAQNTGGPNNYWPSVVAAFVAGVGTTLLVNERNSFPPADSSDKSFKSPEPPSSEGAFAIARLAKEQTDALNKIKANVEKILTSDQDNSTKWTAVKQELIKLNMTKAVVTEIDAMILKEDYSNAEHIKKAIESLRIAKSHIGDFHPSLARPDFKLALKKVATEAVVKEGAFGYTPGSGLPKLIELATEQFNTTSNSPIKKEQLMIMDGGKRQIEVYLSYIADVAKTNGIENPTVLVPELGYPNYTNVAKSMGLNVQTYPFTYDEFGSVVGVDTVQLNNQLENPQVISLIYNSGGHNPTGFRDEATEKEVAGLINAANTKRGESVPVSVLDDQAYICNYLEEIPADYHTLADHIKGPNIAITRTFGKQTGHTGGRVGTFVSLDGHLMQYAGARAGNGGQPARPSQMAMIEVLTRETTHMKSSGPHCEFPELKTMNAALRNNRDTVCEILGQAPDLGIKKPSNGLYVSIGAKKVCDKLGMSISELRDKIQDELGVPLTCSAQFGDSEGTTHVLRYAILLIYD